MNPTDRQPSLFSPTRPYKGVDTVMGIWALRNTVNGKVLLGSSLHTKAALNRQLFSLRLGQHRNAALQRDWAEHGEQAFTTEVLHVLERRDGLTEQDYLRELAELESLWLQELRPSGDAGYHELTPPG